MSHSECYSELPQEYLMGFELVSHSEYYLELPQEYLMGFVSVFLLV